MENIEDIVNLMDNELLLIMYYMETNNLTYTVKLYNNNFHEICQITYKNQVVSSVIENYILINPYYFNNN
jgi:hypothetical protein